MSRYNFSEQPVASGDSQRSRLYDSGQRSPLSLTSERRSSLTSPTIGDRWLPLNPQEYERLAQGYDDDTAPPEVEGYVIYPRPDPTIPSHTGDRLWTRPGRPHLSTGRNDVTSIHTPPGNGHSARVAAASSSPVSPFNHNYRAPLVPPGDYIDSGGLPYSFYSTDFARDASEQFVQPPQPASLPITPPALASLPPGNIDAAFSLVRSPVSSRHLVRSPVPNSTLWWGDLEPWMDEEYAKQVCELMGWDQVTVQIPQFPADPASIQQANNPGYCFLTFPTPQHAASVLSQINSAAASGNQPILPNSTKPFVLNWAGPSSPSPITSTFPTSATVERPASASNSSAQSQQKEYSIFVGDLAPEVSNSDLVAVFRNPVLGLRNDRAPKFIRPFYSCKSAKIMLDPVTGVSRGYGFVRFTDEADQQRALIEMHGLYCLSRPSAYLQFSLTDKVLI